MTEENRDTGKYFRNDFLGRKMIDPMALITIKIRMEFLIMLIRPFRFTMFDVT